MMGKEQGSKVEEKDARIAELESIITHSRQVDEDAWLGRKIKAAVEEERDRCAKIIHEVYLAWFNGDHSPGEAFNSAKVKIRYGVREDGV